MSMAEKSMDVEEEARVTAEMESGGLAPRTDRFTLTRKKERIRAEARFTQMQQHDERVQAIAERAKQFHDCGKRYRIYHGTTNTTRKVKLSKDAVIDTSGMNHVLSIDRDSMTAWVEPNVSMEALVDATLAQAVVPPVVMEFPAITVGGGFAGTAGESSSFRRGLFDNTIEEIEIVLANGEIIRASKKDNSDLLYAAAGSFGTFGVITMLKIQLLPAKQYVELTFSHVAGMEEAVSSIETCTADEKIEYLEGIMFGLHKGVIITGRLTDDTSQGLPISRYTRPQDTWFYLRAQDVCKNELDDYKELVPLKDYLFRYDRGTFWAGMYAFKYFITPFNSWTRRALDSLLRTNVAYHALHKSHMADQYIVQDIGFPYDTVGDFITYVDQKFGFYPLWLCPLKMRKDMSLRPRRMAVFEKNAKSPGMMINVGLWGPGPVRYDDFIQANRDVERKTAELGGLKCFYAQAFYTKDEFWSLYDKKWYDEMRSKYHASGLMSVEEKINVDLRDRKHSSQQPWREWLYERFKEQWPVRGVYGVLHVLTSKEYLLAKR